jgi:hypothetical protein
MDFETADLGLAAFLVALGYQLRDVGGVTGGRRVFRFSIEARGSAPAFYTGASVPARAYANALRDLKALIRER